MSNIEEDILCNLDRDVFFEIMSEYEGLKDAIRIIKFSC